MGFVEKPGDSGSEPGCASLALLAVCGVLVGILVNGPLGPALRSTGEVIGRVKTRFGRAMAEEIPVQTRVPTFIIADDVVVRPGESFEIPCRLCIGNPLDQKIGQDALGPYRLNFTSTGGKSWTSLGSVSSKGGIATFRWNLVPYDAAGTRIMRIDFGGTAVWESSTKFVTFTVDRSRSSAP